ncbi:TolC family protein [Desulfococcaceae bacterium HSG8]|nr:TolC family protein [Desulfococcaceae bacterium HSG8]
MRRYLFFFQLVFCVLFLVTQSLSAQEISGTGEEEKIHAQTPDLTEIRVLDLRTAGQVALAESPSLVAAEARVRQAKERILQARSAYWPRIDATGSSSRVWLSDTAHENALQSARMFNPEADVDDPEDYHRAGLSAAWVLFDGFEREFSVASARFAEQESREARMNTRRLILSSVAAAYYNAQLAIENTAIADADESFYGRQVEDAQARRRVGTGALSDVLTFQVQLNSAKGELIQAKQMYKASLFALAALMGIPEAAFPNHLELAPLESESPEEMMLPDPDAQIAYALEHRPDVLQSGYTTMRAASGVGAARAKFFPTLSLSASLNGERTDKPDFDPDDFGKNIMLNLSYNLFDGGANKAKLRESKLRKTEAEKEMENVRITVASEVRKALTKLESAQEQLLLQRSNADMVRKNRDLVEKEYTAGQTSLVRLNSAQRDLIAAQGRLALAIVSLQQAWHDLKVNTGEILTDFDFPD